MVNSRSELLSAHKCGKLMPPDGQYSGTEEILADHVSIKLSIYTSFSVHL